MSVIEALKIIESLREASFETREKFISSLSEQWHKSEEEQGKSIEESLLSSALRWLLWESDFPAAVSEAAKKAKRIAG